MDYFDAFMKDVIRDLQKDGESYVFSQEQVDYIMNNMLNVTIREVDGIFYLTVDKEKIR